MEIISIRLYLLFRTETTKNSLEEMTFLEIMLVCFSFDLKATPAFVVDVLGRSRGSWGVGCKIGQHSEAGASVLSPANNFDHAFIGTEKTFVFPSKKRSFFRTANA